MVNNNWFVGYWNKIGVMMTDNEPMSNVWARHDFENDHYSLLHFNGTGETTGQWMVSTCDQQTIPIHLKVFEKVGTWNNS